MADENTVEWGPVLDGASGTPVYVDLAERAGVFDKFGLQLPPDGFGFIQFQHGARVTHGVNGVLMEDVLEVLIERLEGYQAGAFPCEENAEALEHLKAALDVLNLRTERRRAQGVEGRDVAHKSEG